MLPAVLPESIAPSPGSLGTGQLGRDEWRALFTSRFPPFSFATTALSDSDGPGDRLTSVSFAATVEGASGTVVAVAVTTMVGAAYHSVVFLRIRRGRFIVLDPQEPAALDTEVADYISSHHVLALHGCVIQATDLPANREVDGCSICLGTPTPGCVLCGGGSTSPVGDAAPPPAAGDADGGADGGGGDESDDPDTAQSYFGQGARSGDAQTPGGGLGADPPPPPTTPPPAPASPASAPARRPSRRG